MAKFLTGNELDDAISDVVFKAEKDLLILSPFIKLDKYFRAIFDNHANNSDLHIVIGFGKNERNVTQSFNNEDFEYFKKFPNISIIYVPNLHAKYYANEMMGIITSINLYDFSFKNNVEYGVLFESNIFSTSKTDIAAWENSYRILNNSFAIFIRKPKFKKKLIGKDYIGSDTLLDLTDDLIRNKKIEKTRFLGYKTEDNFLEIFKLDKKPTREEIEKDDPKRYELPIVNEKKEELNGYCIKCKDPIALNVAYPYCKSCFKSLSKYHQKTDIEKFCHACGKPNKSSQSKPLCYACYK
jgi:hypothetical protein